MSLVHTRLWVTGIAAVLVVCGAAAEDKPLPAFPGAEVWGCETPGAGITIGISACDR